MSWHYRSPLAFPALFLSAMRQAAAFPNSSIMIGAAAKRSELDPIAENFRWFKWCIRQQPNVVPNLAYVLETYDLRTRIKKDEVGFILFLIARPTKMSEFERLNPNLAAEVLSQCQ